MYKASILFVQPIIDDATEIQAKVLKNFVENNKFRDDIILYVLYGENATAKNFYLSLEALKPKMVVFGGHGKDNKIYGEDVLIILDENDYVLKDKIVYSFNCEVGKILSKSKYPIASIGYTDDFIITGNKANLVVSLGLYPVYFLCMGKTVKEAYELTIEEYKRKLRCPCNEDIVKELYHNMKSLVISGDIHAKLF